MSAPAYANSLDELPGWTTDDLAGWPIAWQRSCAREPWNYLKHTSLSDRIASWQAACKSRLPANGPELRRWLQERFEAVAIPEEALVTGYYSPRLAARLAPEPPYTTPLYRKPPDLTKTMAGGRPYWSRAEIDQGALDGKGLEIAWVKPVDAFFLHIQGSGVLNLPGKPPMSVNYAGSNGHAYRAIGADLAEQGAIPRNKITMQTIRAWLAAHPDEAKAVMQRNPRFIFFTPKSDIGPRGASGVVLTAQRSVAIDPGYHP